MQICDRGLKIRRPAPTIRAGCLARGHFLNVSFLAGDVMTDAKIVPTMALFAVLAGFSSIASAKTCSFELQGTDQMKFDKESIAVAADCTEVEVKLKHSGTLPKTAMGHNWVLTDSADFNAVTSAGVTAGPDQNYVPKADKRVIAATKLIGGGESTSIKFPTSKLKKGGDYIFFCSFPGHWSVMKGKFTFG
jgi:azurin